MTHGNWDISSYKVFDALYWYSSLARVAGIVTRVHDASRLVNRNPIDYLWHEVSVYAPGYSNTLPGEVSNRFAWYSYVQTNLFLVPALSSEYDYNGTKESFIEHIGILYLPISPVPKPRVAEIPSQQTRLLPHLLWRRSPACYGSLFYWLSWQPS